MRRAPGQATSATRRRGRIGHEQIFMAKTGAHWTGEVIAALSRARQRKPAGVNWRASKSTDPQIPSRLFAPVAHDFVADLCTFSEAGKTSLLYR
jgi:hypothetical protein